MGQILVYILAHSDSLSITDHRQVSKIMAEHLHSPYISKLRNPILKHEQGFRQSIFLYNLFYVGAFGGLSIV